MTNITHVNPVNAADEPSAVVIPRNHFIILGSMDERPVASLDLRKAVYYVDGADGVADQISVCRKNAADEPEWIEVNDTFQVSIDDAITLTDLDTNGSDVGGGSAVDLTDYTEVKLTFRVKVAGTTGQLKLYYNDGTTSADLTSDVALDSTGLKTTDWEVIPEGARAPIGLYCSAHGGDASEDPQLHAIVAHFRR